MNWLKKGPELKKPDLTLSPFLGDLYYDLRERRLLPLLALAVVAIVAAPFVLGGGSDEEREASAGASTAPPALAGASGANSASLTVVEAKPGLRDYRRRLAHRKPIDPFKQRYAGPKVEGAELNQTESSSSSSSTVNNSSSSEATTISTETTTTTSGNSPSSTPATQPPSSGGGGKQHLTFFAWSVDVWISKVPGKDAAPKAKPEKNAKHRVLPQTPLPGAKAPVVTYMGLSRKAAEKHQAKVLLLVSDDVKSMLGEATCAAGTNACQLFEVAPGSVQTFVYGANETRYKIKVLKIALVVTGHS